MAYTIVTAAADQHGRELQRPERRRRDGQKPEQRHGRDLGQSDRRPHRVTEAGGTAAFTVLLTAQPVTNVVLTVTSGDTGEAAVGPAVLTFTPADWNSAQTVTLTGVDDLDRDGDQITTVTVAVDAGQSDDRFDAVAAQAVSVTTTDDDVGWHNSRNPFDVDANGRVDAADVLTIINYINAHPSDPSLPAPPAVPPPFYDVRNDGLCTAADVLAVINYINSRALATTSGGEGEGASRAATPPDAGLSVVPGAPTELLSANAPLVPMPASSRQVAGESSRHSTVTNGVLSNLSSPATASNPTPIATPALMLREADLIEPGTATRATAWVAGRESQAWDVALETWEPGVEEDVLALLVQDLARRFQAKP